MNESIAKISYCPTWLTNNIQNLGKHIPEAHSLEKKNIINADKKQEKQLILISTILSFYLILYFKKKIIWFPFLQFHHSSNHFLTSNFLLHPHRQVSSFGCTRSSRRIAPRRRHPSWFPYSVGFVVTTTALSTVARDCGRAVRTYNRSRFKQSRVPPGLRSLIHHFIRARTFLNPFTIRAGLRTISNPFFSSILQFALTKI